MKSPIAYYLLLIYLFALCKPVMPLVQDVVSHTFFEHEHMASVHQHGVNNHVKDEVGKMAEKDASDKSIDGAKSFDSIPLHLTNYVAFHCFSSPAIILSHSSFYLLELSSVSLSIQLPPPRA